MHKLPFILICAVTGNVLAESAARAGSARAGCEFVGYNCDACHVVVTDQGNLPLITGYAPSFSEIANRRDTTPKALGGFLGHQPGYSKMRYPNLGPTDLANVVAYITSLPGQKRIEMTIDPKGDLR